MWGVNIVTIHDDVTTVRIYVVSLCWTPTCFFLDIRHPEELSLLRKPQDPKKKKKKLEEAEEDALELEGPLITPGSGR